MRLLLVLFFLMPVTGVQVLTDPSGDVQSQLGGNADGSAVLGARETFDLLSLDVTETPSEFAFALEFANLHPEGQDTFDTSNIRVDLRHEDRSYRLTIVRQVTESDPNYWGRLDRYDSGAGYYTPVGQLELQVDEANNLLTAFVAREDLLDANGAAPYLGRSLQDFRATVSGQGGINLGQVTNNLFSIWDNMPDTGVGTDAYAVVEGVAQSGDARLLSPAPMRSSNGDATTFLYDVTAYNDDPEETRFSLRTLQVPSGWKVTLPGNELRIAGNDQISFKVLVSVPFAHEHGGFDTFTLELRSTKDAGSVGRVELGVRFLEVPQPAGHHDTVHMHTRSDSLHAVNEAIVGVYGRGCLGTFLYFNTQQLDAFDEDLEMAPCQRNFYGTGTQFVWSGNLEPGLSMGMDWILNQTGTVTFDFKSTVPLNNAILTGNIVYIHDVEETNGNNTFTRREWLTVADIMQSNPVAISSLTQVETVLQPRDEADLIPFKEDSELRFNIVLQVAQPDATVGEPTAPVMTAGSIRLPLNEYQDLLTGSVSLSDLRLLAGGPMQRLVNPGETVLFNFTLDNDGPVDERLRLRIVGPNQEWATIVGESTVDVVSGRDRRVTVAIHAPSNAPDQEVAELILSAVSTRDAQVQLTRAFAATVDAFGDQPDESSYVQSLQGQDSPLPLVLLLLALLFVARRVK